LTIFNQIINRKLFYLHSIVVGAAFLFLSISCSQESNSFISKGYHNLTARDNSFFLARERMKEVEKKVYEMRIDDYNQVLHPTPPFDTNKTKALDGQMEDIIKKASIPIRRHKNSIYVDDSYLLIGRCRMYKGQYRLGLETFKFVNTTSDEPRDKQQALIQLMRAYIAYEDYDKAWVACNELDKDTLDKKNIALFNLTKAELLYRQERYDEMLPILEGIADKIKIRDIKSRTYFIIGQLYQSKGNDTAAYKSYKKVTRLNPPYEFLFYSKLYMNQTKGFDKAEDIEKINKYYQKLLKDIKNKEYKDKIYYEMALFEYKQKHYSKAIEYYQLSVRESKSTPQKSLSYYKLATMYYDDLEDFENAQVYYDSCAAIFNKKDKRYPLISKREKVLDEFVKHLKIYKREDSLLRIAALPQDQQNLLIDSLIKAEKEAYRKKQEDKKAAEKKAAEVVFNQDKFSNLDPNNVTWYFNNPTAIKNGIVEFERRWGKRKLEDNWRRATKEIVLDESKPLIKDSTQQKLNAPKEKADEIPELEVDRTKYTKNIPVTAAMKDSSNARIEKALYNIANIYNHKLDEDTRAEKTYLQLLERYPSTNYDAEILYNLYLINVNKNDKKAEVYKNILLRKHPHSIYAKLIINPNYYQDHKKENQIAEREYKNIYNDFLLKKYKHCDSAASVLLTKFPESSVSDKLSYLKIMCRMKTVGPDSIVLQSLEAFIINYPESPIVKNAEDLKNTLSNKTAKQIPLEQNQSTDTLIEKNQTQIEPKNNQSSEINNFETEDPSNLLQGTKK
jgi:tetratricopeptide (TPR) repeat protein